MKKPMVFRSPDGDVSGGDEPRGTAIFDEIPVVEEKIDDDKGAGAEGAETEKDKKAETPVAPVVDAAALAKEFGGVIAEHFKKPEEVVPPKKKYDELSQEEREKLIDLWEPTKDWQTKYDNLETREEALKEMRNGMTKSAATISKLRVDELREELAGSLKETCAFMRERQNQEAEARLAKAYPDLAKPELQPVVKAVSQQLVENGKKFTSESDLFKALADGVVSVFHAGGAKDFKLSTGSNPATTKKAKSANAIPVTTSGSGGGTGGGSGDGPAKARGIAIFD
jgi:hypothetical protein